MWDMIYLGTLYTSKMEMIVVYMNQRQRMFLDIPFDLADVNVHFDTGMSCEYVGISISVK